MCMIIENWKVYFKNYYITKFSSDTTPNAFTTPAPIPTSETTHPITTTVATPGKNQVISVASYKFTKIIIMHQIISNVIQIMVPLFP